MSPEQLALFEQYRPLAHSLADRFDRCRMHGAAQEDVEQESLLWLTKAAQRFDPKRGVSFSHFARGIIWRGLTRYVARNLSATTVSHKAKVWDARSGRDDSELAKVIRGAAFTVDLDDIDLAGDGTSPDAEAAVSELRREVRRRLADVELNPREAVILERRYCADAPATHEEIGALFGVSRQRAHQLEVLLLGRMREALAGLG